MNQLASHDPGILLTTSSVPVSAHVGTDIVIGDLEGEKETGAITVPVFLADVTLSQLSVNIIHVVRDLNLIVFKVECDHVLISEEQEDFLLVLCFDIETIAEHFAEALLTWLLADQRQFPFTVLVLTAEVNALTWNLAAAISEED